VHSQTNASGTLDTECYLTKGYCVTGPTDNLHDGEGCCHLELWIWQRFWTLSDKYQFDCGEWNAECIANLKEVRQRFLWQSTAADATIRNKPFEVWLALRPLAVRLLYWEFSSNIYTRFKKMCATEHKDICSEYADMKKSIKSPEVESARDGVMTTARTRFTARTQSDVGRVYWPQKLSGVHVNTEEERGRGCGPPCQKRGVGSYTYINTYFTSTYTVRQRVARSSARLKKVCPQKERGQTRTPLNRVELKWYTSTVVERQ